MKKRTTQEFIDAAVNVHGMTFDYSNVVYDGVAKKVIIRCPKHGEFKQTPRDHLTGRGCPRCGYESMRVHNAYTTEKFVALSNKIHNNRYGYSKTNYVRVLVPVIITCPIHGDFKQVPAYHLDGCGCPVCGKTKALEHAESMRYVKEDFIRAAKETHGDRRDIADVIKQHYDGTIRLNPRDVIPPKELDIYLPDLKLAIEYHGLIFHSNCSTYARNDYRTQHRWKYVECAKRGIKLIQIFETEWLQKQDVVKSRLLSVLGRNVKIGARTTEVREISSHDSREFLEQNHIQGFRSAKVHLGLYNDAQELLSVMTFSVPRYSTHYQWEMLRFATKQGVTVVGGASKLFSAFVKQYDPQSVVSYADLRWGTGHSYEALGFVHDHDSSPNYFYFNPEHEKTILESRVKFQKHKLSKKLAVFDPLKSEKENMIANGYYHIYDCGNAVYVWRKELQ